MVPPRHLTSLPSLYDHLIQQHHHCASSYVQVCLFPLMSICEFTAYFRACLLRFRTLRQLTEHYYLTAMVWDVPGLTNWFVISVISFSSARKTATIVVFPWIKRLVPLCQCKKQGYSLGRPSWLPAILVVGSRLYINFVDCEVMSFMEHGYSDE